jgi:hypothetical protein
VDARDKRGHDDRLDMAWMEIAAIDSNQPEGFTRP